MPHSIIKAKTLLGYATPLSGSQCINILASILPMLFIARLGTQQLAAAALASATVIIFSATTMFAMMAIGILISHEHEKQNTTQIGLIFRHGLILGVVMVVFFGVILWNMGYFLLLSGQNPALVKFVIPYLHLGALSLLPMIVLTLMKQFYIGIAKPRYSLYISLLLSPLTIFLSYGFILGKYSMPQLGLEGMMLAILIAQIVVCLSICCVFIVTGQHRIYSVFQNLGQWSTKLSKEIIYLALPISIQSASEIIAISITTYMLGWFGKDALAAAQIVNQYVVLCVVIYLGFSQAMSIVCSKALVHNDYRLIKEYMYIAIMIMTALFIGVAVIFIRIPHTLIAIFLGSHTHHDQAIFQLGREFFIIALFANYADSLRYILSGAYRGLKDAKKPMYIGIFCLWIISIMSGYILAIPLHFGPIGLRMGIAVGIICATLYLLYDFFVKKV